MIKNNSGFTLVEILIASTISMVLLGGIMAVFLTSLNVWVMGSTDMSLERYGTLTLEKIVRGMGGRYGLREANGSTIAIDADGNGITFTVDKNDPPTSSAGDDTTVRVYLDPSNGNMMYDPDTSIAGNAFNISREGVVRDITFTQNGDVISVDVWLSQDVTPSSRTVEMRFQTSVSVRKSG